MRRDAQRCAEMRRDAQRCADGTVENVERVRKPYKEKLRPTSAQERRLDETRWRCRTLYNTALEQRSTAWHRCHASVSR
jgi:hypothetical protein